MTNFPINREWMTVDEASKFVSLEVIEHWLDNATTVPSFFIIHKDNLCIKQHLVECYISLEPDDE